MVHYRGIGSDGLLMPVCVILRDGQPGRYSDKGGTVRKFSKEPDGSLLVNTRSVTGSLESSQEIYN